MLKHTPNFTQQKPKSQLQSVVTSLERLTKVQQNNISNVAAYNAHSHDFRYDQRHGGQSTLSGPRHDSDHLAKLVRDEVHRQKNRFIAPTNRLCHTRFPFGNHTMEIYIQMRNHSNKELTTHSTSSRETSCGFFIPGRWRGEVFTAN